MHILLIHQAFVSPQQAGGTRHFEFARRFAANGRRFTIVASAVSYIDGKRIGNRNGLVSKERCQGVNILRAYTFPAIHRSFVWRVVSFLSFMFSAVLAGLRAGRVDLVMGTSPPIFQAVSAWLVARSRGVPFLLEIRDLWPEFAIDMGVLKNTVLIRLSRWLEMFLYRRATHLLVNSPAYRDYLVEKGIPAERVTLIANGVDPQMFDPKANGNGFRDRWGLVDKFVVTYAGALGMANDIPTVLQAAQILREDLKIAFLLVGDGKERENLQAQARQMKLPNVIFTGPLPKAQMPEVLAASDACTATLMDIPMFRTTYPNKVFDYMAAGRPTILAIDGVIRNVVEDAGGGIFVPPGNPDAFAAAVTQLAAERDNARRMGDAARRYVTVHFNRDRQAKEFVGLVEHLVL